MPEVHRQAAPAGLIRRSHATAGDGRIRLIAFPAAGASASMFRAWAGWLPGDIELWPARLPGRQDRLREAPFTGIAPLVRTLAAELERSPGKPFAFFGHSLGALIAFELARELRRRSCPQPSQLFVASCAAPRFWRDRPRMSGLPDDALVRQLRMLDGIPEEVVRDRELLHLVVPALRADVLMSDTYVHMREEPLAVPISVFGGARDRFMKRADLSAWREQTTAGFELRILDGGHFFAPPAERLMVGTIAGQLRRARGDAEADPVRPFLRSVS